MTEEITALPVSAVSVRKRRKFLVDLSIRLWKEKPLGTIGAFIVLILLILGIFASLDWLPGDALDDIGIAPYRMNEIHLRDRLLNPMENPKYFLGTDQLGRDIVSRLIYGARVSMIIGLVASGLSTFVNILIGATSGFLGGKTDIVLQRFVDAFMSIPSLLILLTVMSIVGSGLIQIIMVIGISSGIRGSRVIRSAVIGIKENMYVSAAEAIGCSTMRSLLRHILPNVMAPILISFTLMMGQTIMMEASLSFLGYGVPPGVPSWGSMLAGEGRQYMELAPLLAVWPGLALTIVVYGINMFGDALRDLLDPRLRGGLGRYSGVKRKKMKELKEE
jgi:peptide/nickel transport system permease protein